LGLPPRRLNLALRYTRISTLHFMDFRPSHFFLFCFESVSVPMNKIIATRTPFATHTCISSLFFNALRCSLSRLCHCSLETPSPLDHLNTVALQPIYHNSHAPINLMFSVRRRRAARSPLLFQSLGQIGAACSIPRHGYDRDQLHRGEKALSIT
jgi:hypothetical protein